MAMPPKARAARLRRRRRVAAIAGAIRFIRSFIVSLRDSCLQSCQYESTDLKYVQDNISSGHQGLFEPYLAPCEPGDAMAYSAGHRDAVKKRVIDSARKL